MNDADFTGLCRELMPGMYRMSLSMLQHHADAQDAVQQALMKAWARRHTVRTGAEKAWLMRIVINECHNIHRQRKRMQPVEHLPERGYTPPDTALRDAMEALPAKWRLPLLLKYMEGMSEMEVAKALGITQSAVKGRLFRARKALEKTLKEEVELG